MRHVELREAIKRAWLRTCAKNGWEPIGLDGIYARLDINRDGFEVRAWMEPRTVPDKNDGRRMCAYFTTGKQPIKFEGL